MGIDAEQHQNRLTRTGVSTPVGEDEPPFVVWANRFILLFLAMVIIAMVTIWLSNEVSTSQKLVANAIALALVAWYWFAGRWHIVLTDRHAIIYLVGNLIGVVALIAIWDGNGLFLCAAYWLGFAYLRVIPALTYSLALTLGSQWSFGTFGDTVPEFSRNTAAAIGLIIILVLFSGLMARFIEAFQEESEKSKRLLAELESAQASLAQREREAGMADERTRLAGEIHDTIAQQFTSVITNLRATQSSLDALPAPARTHIENAFEAANQGLADSRAMLSTMQPDVLSGKSLSDVLQETTVTRGQKYGYSADFHQDGEEQPLDRPVQTILVRALQESLRNTGKHAHANRVTVTLNWLEDEVILDIQDDGRGFDPEAVAPGEGGHHMGLLTMQDRVERAGGTFALESAPREGASIAISFPTGEAT